MRIIGIDSVRRLLTENTGWLSRCLWSIRSNYSVLYFIQHLATDLRSKPVLNDIPWYSQFQPLIGNTGMQCVCSGFSSTWETDFRYGDGKTAVDENKAPAHIRMQDDAGGIIVVKSSVQYICLDLRPCSVDLCISGPESPNGVYQY